MYRKHRGFTLVEIAIVVVVVSLLSSITVVAFTKVQSSARDNARESGAIAIADSLEKYYETNGEYPGCTAITGSASSVVPSVLAGVSASTLRTPLAPANDDNSITCGDSTITTQDIFAYVGDSTGACTSGAACLEFRLRWRQESDGVIREIKGLHQTSVATSGSLSVTASATGVTTGSASWNAISNSTGYMVQLSRNSDFTDIVSDLTVAGLSTTFSGLSQDTQYYVRVAALALSSQGDWSNTASFRTVAVPVPTLTNAVQSSTSIILYWTAVSGAQSYQLESSPDNTSWTAISTANVNTFTSTGLAQGKRMYYRVRSLVGGVPSNWSTTNAVTTIDAPAAFNLTSSRQSWNWWNIDASQAVCPSGTTRSWDWWYVSNMRSGGAWTPWVGGAAYDVVGFNTMWDESVTVYGYAQCKTPDASSGFTQGTPAASFSMPSTSASLQTGGTTQPLWRSMHWVVYCPAYTTSWNFHLWTSPAVGIDFWTQTNDGWYDKESIAWGDGNSWIQAHCYGPWGDLVVERSASYGNGCIVPTSLAICYSRSPY